MTSGIGGADGGGSDSGATKILNQKVAHETGSLKGMISNMSPSASMDSQLEMTRGVQQVSLYYTMALNLINTFDSLLMKAINGIHVPQG